MVFQNSGKNYFQIPDSHKFSTKETLDLMFPEQLREEKELIKVKLILGDLASGYSTQEFKEIVTEIQYLADSWLDDFEKSIFKGETLLELLHDKNNR